ncbi:MAG: ankyrin repeat domain-containing protein [Ramlibacter sp.]
MNADEKNYLRSAFGDLLNYEAGNLEDPIDPLTYRTPEGDTCLHIAAHRGDLEAIRILVASGMSVNLKGDMGITPLHNACLAKNSQAANLLISLGADKSIADEFGRLPAFW